jgi:hypothetical protein
MSPWFDHSGRDMRSLDEWEREERAGLTFRRLFVRAFAVAAVIGLLAGLLWTVAGLWHVHVSPLF